MNRCYFVIAHDPFVFLRYKTCFGLINTQSIARWQRYYDRRLERKQYQQIIIKENGKMGKHLQTNS